MFDCEEFILPEKAVYKKDVTNNTPIHEELKIFIGDDDLLVSDGQSYRNNDLIVLVMKDCDIMEAGVIQEVVFQISS